MTIRLKCWAESFDAIASGRKRCEIRRTDDRTFSVGDVLLLIRSAPDGTPAPAGGWLQVRVTWINSGAGALEICGYDPGDLDTDIPLSVLSIDLLAYGPGAPPSE